MRRFSLTVRRMLLALSCTVRRLAGRGGRRPGGRRQRRRQQLRRRARPEHEPAGRHSPGQLERRMRRSIAGARADLADHRTGLAALLPRRLGASRATRRTSSPGIRSRDYWATTRQYVEQFLSDVATASGASARRSRSRRSTRWPTEPFMRENVSTVRRRLHRLRNQLRQSERLHVPVRRQPSERDGQQLSGQRMPEVRQQRVDGAAERPDQHLAQRRLPDRRPDPGRASEHDAPRWGCPAGTLQLGIQLQPLVDVLTPPGVEVCLDSAGHVCSANSAAGSTDAQFCSYHSQVQCERHRRRVRGPAVDGAVGTRASGATSPTRRTSRRPSTEPPSRRRSAPSW